ncbi:MAG: hypothetical protein HPY59_17155 [Anaerolineae bacterium]|nr:hypothetical protein [Anaerolineae bacterium]
MFNSPGLRFIFVLLIALTAGWAISEISYLSLRPSGRDTPQQVELVIPKGTAELIEYGKEDPAILKEMTFVAGDILVVRNEDITSHQLGPIWVPPGSSGVLTLNSPNFYQLSCSFQPGRVMGIDVRPGLTTWIRLQGVLSIGIPSGVLFWLYSLVLWPIRRSSSDVL